MASFFQEFKKFIKRGNMIDLAVGIIVGAAFGKVVTTLVDAVLMPPIGALIGGVNFSVLAITIPGTTATIRYGLFLQALIDFLIIGFCVFLVVKAVNKLEEKLDGPAEEKPKEIPPQEQLLIEIRDLLKAKT